MVDIGPRRTGRVPHALTRLGGALTLAPLEQGQIGDVEPNLVTLGTGGWSLAAQPRWPRAAGGAPVHWSAERSLLQVDLATMTSHRLGWTPRPGGAMTIDYSPSPDGAHVLVAEVLTRQGVRDPGPLTLLVVPTGGGEARELLTLPPSGFLGRSDDTFLQWSPDGRMVALTFRENGAFGPTTVVVEVSTGDVVCRATSTRLMGSLSFSDDGTRVLVGTSAMYPHVLDVGTGARTPVAWLPDSKPDPGPRLTACGFVGGDHLLATRQRTGTVTVSAVHLDRGEETPLLRWAGGRRNAPHTGVFSRHWLTELERVTTG